MSIDITPYVESLRRDLLAAADSAGPQAREITERLGFALDPAVRLVVMEAVSQAAAEITAALASGSVDVRLDGRELDFVVTGGGEDATVDRGTRPASNLPAEAAEDEGQARVSLRLPESLKARADEAAARAGQSLNTWLVSLVRGATGDGALRVDVDLSSRPVGADFAFGATPPGRRLTGWL